MSEQAVTDEAICQIIKGVISKSAAKGGVTPEMNLQTDLGVDSLGLMSIAFVLEEQVGVDAFSHVDQFINAEYVSDIIKIVREN
ncbi:acyl carrier protein [Salinactinospora qingdaonensis]|uniref:Carrier domain-containing protein n=1 Tax=Salinactinospora qingdaonensis TaxID=702744 RepID=A0ABP7G3S6_9ACTN